MAGKHRREVRIALRGEDGDCVPDGPEHNACYPEPKPDAEGGGNGAVDDRYGARGAAEQDRLGQRPMQRDLETFDRPAGHDTSAPPPKEKKERKKLDAAKAI